MGGHKWANGSNTNNMTLEQALDKADEFKHQTLLHGTDDLIADFRIVREEQDVRDE